MYRRIEFLRNNSLYSREEYFFLVNLLFPNNEEKNLIKSYNCQILDVNIPIPARINVSTKPVYVLLYVKVINSSWLILFLNLEKNNLVNSYQLSIESKSL